jgi:hypothetical protein
MTAAIDVKTSRPVPTPLSLARESVTTAGAQSISDATWATYRAAVRRDLGDDVYEIAAERRASGPPAVSFPARVILDLYD